MVKWIKDKIGITELEQKNKNLLRLIYELRNENANLRIYVYNSMKELKDYTRVDADVGFNKV